MFEQLRRADPGRSPTGILFYRFCQFVSRTLLTLGFRYRCWGRDHVPPSGPLLVVCNHQSHLDPVIAGLLPRTRQCWFIARSTLFGNRAFMLLISTLNAIPVRQGEPDSTAMRTAIDTLKAGKALMIFPEGSRTPDGSISSFKRGAWLILSRSKAAVLPVAIEGAYDAWPRSQSLPRLWRRRLGALAGPAIPAERLLAMGEQAGLEYLAATVEALRVELRRRLEADGATLSTRPRRPL